MHARDLVLTSFLLLSVTAASAQKQQQVPMKPQMRVVKTDTLVVKKSVIKPSGDPKLAMAVTRPAIPAKKVYKPVPLAGEAYYGTMNDYIKDFVRKYLKVHSRSLSVIMGRGNTKFSQIDKILEQHDIPKELKYLAVIESALNNNAVSRVGAVGPWQFMASTARLMGLKVSKKRDERRDLHKSTNAAAKYLSYLYDQLNDWLLVVAAYNSGPAPVHRAIKRTGSTNFWDIKKHLPKETQGHVLAFIATATIFENLSGFIGESDIPDADDLNFSKDASPTEKKASKPKLTFTTEELQNMAIVRLSEPLSLDLMVLELGIDQKLLDKWNPDYELFELGTYSGEYYSFRIPKDKLDNFIEKKDMMTRKSKQIFSAMNG